PQFAHCLHGIGTGRLPFHRAQTRRHDTVITAALKRVPENSLGHGAAANVARANEKDRLHLCVNLMNLSRGGGIVNGEIMSAWSPGFSRLDSPGAKRSGKLHN